MFPDAQQHLIVNHHFSALTNCQLSFLRADKVKCHRTDSDNRHGNFVERRIGTPTKSTFTTTPQRQRP
jgi:hypothetical protein